jgi:hypothetical protein
MSTDTVFLIVRVTGCGGLLVGLLALTVALLRRGRVPNEPADATIGASPYYRCTTCGQPTSHERTGTALTCRTCGTAYPEAL